MCYMLVARPLFHYEQGIVILKAGENNGVDLIMMHPR